MTTATKSENRATQLMVKDVLFEDFNLKAAQDKGDNNVYVGAKWICNGIGLTRGQSNGEIVKIQSDLVLKRGCTKFRAGVFDDIHETVALQIDYLPLWLAKISITPTMQRENPRVVEKLISYQLKAKDVLAAAFLPVDYQTDAQQEILKQMAQKYDQLLEFQKNLVSDSKELKSEVSFIKSQLLKITPAPRFTNWKKNVNYKIKVLAEIGQITKNTFLHNVYVKFTEMGYDLNEMKKQYCEDNGLVNCSTLDFIESNNVLREKFDLILNNMGTFVNEKMEQMATEREQEIQELPYVDPIKSAISPLIEKLNDKSHGGNLTYRKVYIAMNVGWANRQTRYKKLHNLKNPPKKITLVENDEKLTKLFIKTVNVMLAE